MPDSYDKLDFPQRAEYLSGYKNYQVDITHWRDLSAQFAQTFRRVYTRRSAAVLLVYGPMGSGKSLFCRRLVEDYDRSRGEPSKQDDGDCRPDVQNNLWHSLIAANDPTEEQIREVTKETKVELVGEGDLTEIRKRGVESNLRARLLLLDDAQKDGMVRPWTELLPGEFYEAKQRGPDALLAHVAERINHACRHELQRSIFVMLSNDKKWLQALKESLDQWFQGLASLIDLPVPQPRMLERIVRINTNRLNRMSYWYRLDAATYEKRRHVRNVLMDRSKGFTESFDAVSESIAGDSRRPGRAG